MTAPAPLDNEERARRLTLLLDTIPRNGTRATFAQVQAFLAERGVSISQARWTYLTRGEGGYTRINGEDALMTAIAAFFQVDRSYLLDRAGPVPEALEQQLELLRQVRLREVRLYATRKLGGVSPDTLEEINRILNGHNPLG